MTDDFETTRIEADDERSWTEALRSMKRRPTIRIKRRRLEKATSVGAGRLDGREPSAVPVREREGRVFQVAAPTVDAIEVAESVVAGSWPLDAGSSGETIRVPGMLRRRRRPSHHAPGPVTTVVYERVALESEMESRPPSDYRATLEALEKLRVTLEEVRAAQSFCL